MAIAMIYNISGNLGKSTVAKHGLKPRMNDATIIPVETINSHEHGDDVQNIKGTQMGDLLSALALLPDAIVDVGSSNAAAVLNKLGQYEGAHENFDYFIVPVIPAAKQIRDTIATIEALSEIGVPSEKIRIIFNMIEDVNTDLSKEFAPLFAYHKAEKKFTLNQNAVIYEQDFFIKVANTGETVESILADETDYKSLLLNAKTSDERLAIAQKRSLGYLAKSVKRNLDTAIAAVLE